MNVRPLKCAIFGLFSCFFLNCFGAEDRSYSFKVEVKDENGIAVVGAEVSFTFLSKSIPLDKCVLTATSDEQGRVTFVGKAYALEAVNVSKEGFYQTVEKVGVFLKRKFTSEGGVESYGNWEPEGSVIGVVLKKRGPKVPMYAKNEVISLPDVAAGHGIGYDFEVGDFVSPYGKGAISDAVFIPSISGENIPGVRWRLEMIFPRAGDGIVVLYSPIGNDSPNDRGSELRSPSEAPFSGYQSKIVFEDGNSRKGNNYGDYIYLLRLRSELGESGEIKKAWYGKMYRGPRLGRAFRLEQGSDLMAGRNGVESDYVSFTYHINPNGRGLEFDWQMNLLKDLKRENRVGGP